jgi:hypothetical protein
LRDSIERRENEALEPGLLDPPQLILVRMLTKELCDAGLRKTAIDDSQPSPAHPIPNGFGADAQQMTEIFLAVSFPDPSANFELF